MNMAMTPMTAVRAASYSGWTVAVTGCDGKGAGPGDAVIRCLRRAPDFGGRIVGLGDGDLAAEFGMDSECDAGYAVPAPVAGANALLDRIDEIRREERIDAVIPCLEAELPNYITLQPALARRGIRLMLPDRATLYSRNKDYLPTLCARAEVATPRVRRITQESFFDLKGIDGDFWHYPMVVKGIFHDAYVVHSPDEAKRRFHQVAAAWGYPVLVQEFIAGEEVALAALGDGSGAMVDAVAIEKRGAAGMVIDDPDLRAAGRRLMAGLKWHGPLEMEMLRDQAGRLHLIEINPRFPAWIDLAAGFGRNLPALLLALLHGKTHEYGELVPPSWWNREPAFPARRQGWVSEPWSLAGFAPAIGAAATADGPLARFCNRGDHGMPAWSSDYSACPTP